MDSKGEHIVDEKGKYKTKSELINVGGMPRLYGTNDQLTRSRQCALLLGLLTIPLCVSRSVAMVLMKVEFFLK